MAHRHSWPPSLSTINGASSWERVCNSLNMAKRHGVAKLRRLQGGMTYVCLLAFRVRYARATSSFPPTTTSRVSCAHRRKRAIFRRTYGQRESIQICPCFPYSYTVYPK